jgi:hypothetical protein
MARLPPIIMKLAMPISLTSILSQRARRQTNRYANFESKFNIAAEFPYSN